MRKQIIIMVFIFFIYCTSLHASTFNVCEDIFIYYNVNVKLKSNSGWHRVCNNGKLNLYININNDYMYNEHICRCLIENSYIDHRQLDNKWSKK